MSVRHAGLNVPLFSIRSRNGWGIGELTDIVRMAGWLADAGLDRLMLLPLGTVPPAETSPYSALSTLSIDPIYITLPQVSDFVAAGGIEALSSASQEAIASARLSDHIWYDLVRQAKGEALRLAFGHFVAHEWELRSARAVSFAEYVARERDWLDDYALFLALRAGNGGASWREWPRSIADRDPAALADARHQLADEVRFHQYTQWIAEQQWQQARAAARTRHVSVFGDLPFVASTDSPEVWARADEFHLDVSAGVPPDRFSDQGQDWGLPTYRWDVIAAGGYAWMRQRARRMAALFDGLRVDHVIGLFRTYGRPRTGDPFFTPALESEQIAQGRALLQILAASGLTLIAEDLGLVPDFVRTSLADLGVPGCKVLRWERQWDVPGAPYIAPEDYEERSAAMTGTHDTVPVSVWWTTTTEEERIAFLAILGDGRVTPAAGEGAPPWSGELRDRVLRAAYRAGSAELLLPVQDVFGWPDRINTPGTVGPHNWTWCLPWSVDEWHQRADPQERAAFLRELARETGRGTAP